MTRVLKGRAITLYIYIYIYGRFYSFFLFLTSSSPSSLSARSVYDRDGTRTPTTTTTTREVSAFIVKLYAYTFQGRARMYRVIFFVSSQNPSTVVPPFEPIRNSRRNILLRVNGRLDHSVKRPSLQPISFLPTRTSTPKASTSFFYRVFPSRTR